MSHAPSPSQASCRSGCGAAAEGWAAAHPVAKQAAVGSSLDVIGEYVSNMAEGHAKVRMDEVRRHLADTYFAWIGGAAQDAVFYYRIHSPVILIEFDHQTPIALPGAKVPTRAHVHSVVRTPNGNDYGKDLLRQHHERHKGDLDHGHR